MSSYEFLPIAKQPDLPDSPDKSIATRPKSPIKYILEVQKFRTRQDLLKLRIAIDDSENIKSYNRYLLHQIYRDILKDPNLYSQWESRKMKTKERPFRLVKPDLKTEDKEATNIFDSVDWFIDYIDAVLESKAWGFSLIEFGPMTPEGLFMPYQVNGKLYPAVNTIDRDNVKPQLGIITDIPGNTTGISMSDPKFADYLQFVGTYRNYGFYISAAKYILFKDNCLGNWSEWAEIFGMDTRIGYTDTEGDDRERFIRSVRDMGTSSYGVFTTRDKVEYVGTTRTDAYMVYEKMIAYIDQQVSKLVFGQDVVTNNTGRVVGEVGENVSNMYGNADAKFVAAQINQRLIPQMIKLGCKKLERLTFVWDTTEKLGLEERIKVDKTINDMGFKFSPDYINQTYGVDVEEKKEEEPKNENEL